MNLELINPAREGYRGQNLHIIRNDQWVMLTDYFKPSLLSGMRFLIKGFPNAHFNTFWPIPGSTDSFTYADVTFSLDSSNNLKVKAATASTSLKLHSFSLAIVSPTYPTNPEIYGSIDVQIHDDILQVWVSPDLLSIGSFQNNAKSGVFARFTGNIVANISWHPGITWASISLPSYLGVDTADGRVSIIGTLPSSLPIPYSYEIEMTLPTNMQSGSLTCASGFINVNLDSLPAVDLIHGDYTKCDTWKNVLVVADGYKSTEHADFCNHASSIVSYMNSSPMAVPWNILGGKINYWAVFIPSREGGGIAENGDTIIYASSGSNVSTLLIDRYLTVCKELVRQMCVKFVINLPSWYEKAYNYILQPGETYMSLTIYRTPNVTEYSYLDSFIDWTVLNLTSPYITLPSGIAPTYIMEVQEICDLIGLPGVEDAAMSITDKKDQLNLLMPAGASVKLLSDTTFGPNDRILTPFVHMLWKKMINRSSFAYPDTTWGATSNPEERLMYMHPFRAKDRLTYGKNIRGIKFSYYNDSGSLVELPIGETFFNSDGTPVTDAGGRITNANFVLMLARLQHSTITGERSNIYLNVSPPILQSVAIVDTNKGTVLCEAIKNIPGNPYNIIPNVSPPLAQLEVIAKATAVHEFSHVWLHDEYTTMENSNFSSKPVSFQLFNTRELNVQSEYSLKHPPLASSAGLIDPAYIKWNWPRIEAIALLTADITTVPTPNQFHVKLSEISPATAPALALFQRVMLRVRHLDKTIYYPQFLICAAVPGTTDEFIIEQQDISPSAPLINVADYTAGSLFIRPHWTTGSDYKKLIHPKTYSAMAAAMKPLTPYDDRTSPQGPGGIHTSATASAPMMQAFSGKEYKIVGAFAGGLNEYDRGIYHPTGFCIMREQQDSVTGNTPQVNYFCHVCRYTIVDDIDPLQHPIIDQYFSSDYPA